MSITFVPYSDPVEYTSLIVTMNILRCRQTKLEDKQKFCNDREKLLYFKHERNRGDEIQVVSNLRLYLMNTNLLVCNLWLYQIMVVAHDVCGKSGSLPQQSTRKSPPKIKQKKHVNYEQSNPHS